MDLFLYFSTKIPVVKKQKKKNKKIKLKAKKKSSNFFLLKGFHQILSG